MRQFSKIILIDSADFEYEEFDLTGHTHLQGDQGAGKTTTERAILFFYNANKQKLGIESNTDKKGFLDFYLPRKTSCVVYEVTRENGTFSILTYQKDKRQVWRIIDCPFDIKFLTKENGILLKVADEWNLVEMNIGKETYISPEIRTSKDYLNIIYGNLNAFNNKERHLWRRFSLMESNKFQSFVNIMQKIFLDSNQLEAGEITQTLIDTILTGSENKPEIKLEQYADTITNITARYDDILKWFKTENGRIPIRDQAEEVKNTYQELMDAKENIQKLCKALAAAIRSHQRRIPVIEEDVRKLEADIWKKQQEKERLDEKHKKESDSLQQKLGELKGKIRYAKGLKDKYDNEEFQDVLNKVARKNESIIQYNSLDEQIKTLLDKSISVAEKFDSAIKTLNDEVTRLTNYAMEEKLKIDKQLMEDEQKARATSDSEVEEVNKERDDKMEKARENLDRLNSQHTQFLLDIEGIKHRNPYQEDMDRVQVSLNENREELHQAQLKESELKGDVERITNQTENEIDKVKREADSSISILQATINNRQKEILKLNDLLERQNGSFIQWLDENVKGWEGNIGKVVDEEAILYNQELNPELDTNSNAKALFGVCVQLDSIQKDILTPQKIKDEIAKLSAENSKTDREIRNIQAERDKKIADLRQKANTKLAPLNKKLREVRLKIQTLPQEIKKLEAKEEEQNSQLKKWRDEQTEMVRSKDDSLQLEINKAKDAIKNIKEIAKKKVQDLKKVLKTLVNKLQKEAENAKEMVDNRLKAKTDEIHKNIEFHQQQKKKALADEGVDTNALQVLQDKLDSTKKTLQEIDFLMPRVNEYNQNKKNFIDHLDEWKAERTKTYTKIENLDTGYKTQFKNLSDSINEMTKEKDDNNKRLESIKTDIDNAQRTTREWGWELEYDDKDMTESKDKVGDVLTTLYNTRIVLGEKMELLQKKVTVFSNNFTENNQFKFRKNFVETDDYIDAAKDIVTFVEENRIEEFRNRINAWCENFIGDIRNDMVNLFQFNSDIGNIINKINEDIENENFVSSINSIRLRKNESTNPIVQQLINIQTFYEEYQEHLFEMDLFPTDPESSKKTKQKAMELLGQLKTLIDQNVKDKTLGIEDTFRLEMRVIENKHDSGWREIVKSPGSNGTSLLVLTILHITLLNVFKEKLCKKSAKYADLRIHCLLDEGGRLYEKNIEGLVQFADRRNINLILVTPNAIDDVKSYKHHYLLYKEQTENRNITRMVDLLETE